MKTFRIASVLILVLAFNLSFGQSSQVVAKVHQKTFEKNLKTPKEELSNSAASLDHSKAAVAQIKKLLVQNLVYPEQMLENGMEGQVVLKVDITPNGKIKEASIAKSINIYFDKAALSAIKGIKALHLKGGKYSGVATVYVPINFSIAQ